MVDEEFYSVLYCNEPANQVTT